MSNLIFMQDGNKFKLEVPPGTMIFSPVSKAPCRKITLYLDKPLTVEEINCTMPNQPEKYSAFN